MVMGEGSTPRHPPKHADSTCLLGPFANFDVCPRVEAEAVIVIVAKVSTPQYYFFGEILKLTFLS